MNCWNRVENVRWQKKETNVISYFYINKPEWFYQFSIFSHFSHFFLSTSLKRPLHCTISRKKRNSLFDRKWFSKKCKKTFTRKYFKGLIEFWWNLSYSFNCWLSLVLFERFNLLWWIITLFYNSISRCIYIYFSFRMNS